VWCGEAEWFLRLGPEFGGCSACDNPEKVESAMTSDLVANNQATDFPSNAVSPHAVTVTIATAVILYSRFTLRAMPETT